MEIALRRFAFILCSLVAASCALSVSEELTREQAPCDLLLSLVVPNGVLQLNGSLWEPEGQVTYPPGTFWRSKEDWKPVYRVCPCKLPNRPCMRKCCLTGEVMIGKGQCTNSSRPFIMNVTRKNETLEVDVSKHFALLFGNPCSGERYMLEPLEYPTDEFYVNASTGNIIVPFQKNSEHGPKDFCIEYFPEKGAYLPLVCFPPIEEDKSNQLIYTMYPVGMLVSIPFLVVTFLVYALIPRLRNLHGLCLMCHVSSLVTAYTFLAVVQLAGNKLGDRICIASAFIIEFSFLATFFWLNIMCFDICLTFR
ncbi:hypothetical protein J437_LFUL017873 [Ladona fulva]|uniref:Methuselah N-terminal domain-containing protein n=1 Tax=Ladona fulva TaxID=123851 RepID=A0A8K0KNM9_LADFU|nr:hypothetical protein J437_LFUL017873 [Ladona fulva]